jgi:hypothetical protein
VKGKICLSGWKIKSKWPMGKDELIQQLNKTYNMEKSHAFFTFPAIAIYLLFNHSLVDILFLLYGLILCIFI